MRVLAGHRHLVPADALAALHDADHRLLVLQDGTLLDMKLEHGAEFPRAHLLLALEADALELIDQDLAVTIGERVRLVAREHAGEHARPEHRLGEARAFLVGPVDELERRIGLVAGLVQRPQHLEPGEHTEHAVELAAGRLGVEVRADRDRREIGAFARPPREHVAELVDRYAAADRLGLAPKPVADRLVLVAQGQPLDAALRGAAVLGGFHEIVPQPLRIDLQIAYHHPSFRLTRAML
jgi:hypothetical protein